MLCAAQCLVKFGDYEHELPAEKMLTSFPNRPFTVRGTSVVRFLDFGLHFCLADHR